MPETSRASLCVVDIANQLCGVGEAGSHQPSPALTEAALSNKEDPGSSREILLTQLNVSLRELIDMATETQKQMQPWKMLPPVNLASLNEYVTSALQIPPRFYRSCIPDEDSKLHILVQISSYAVFLKNQQNDEAYGEVRTQIKDLQLKIMQAGRVLRKLLQLGNEDIKNYIVQSNTGDEIALGSYKAPIKRAVCSIAMDVMLSTVKKITVSVDSSSITMS